MATKFMVLSAIAVSGVGLSGCASLQPREAFPDIANQIENRTGVKAVWNQGTVLDDEAEKSLSGILSGEMSANGAVQVALLNNRNVQATYEELGIAQAELVQAGLLKNPVFSALVRMPDSGNGGANVELSVAENFIELLSMPLRKKVAAAQYDAARVRVTGEIMSLTADVKTAFYTVQGAEQMVEMRRSVVDATASSFEAAKRIREAGNSTELALANEQALFGEAKLDLAQAEAELVKDRERLLALLGLWGPKANIKISSRLPELPPSDDGLENIESIAVSQRLDLAAAVKDLNALYKSLGVTEQFNVFQDSELSLDAERETDGSWVMGPGLSIPIPIFDNGSAQVLIARARVRQATQRIYALAVQIRSEARSARAQMVAARARSEYYRQTVIPLRQKITHETQLQFNGMLTGVFQLLQAKREEIDAGRDYIESLQSYWLARAELERAIGGRLDGHSISSTDTTPMPQMSEEHKH